MLESSAKQSLPVTVLPEGVRRVASILQARGHTHAPQMLDDAARTAQQAADALGIQVGQIAKSIIFRRKADDVAVLVITAGDRRVDERKVAALIGSIGRADADFVKARTGFSIGGVSPVGHASPPVTLVDASLFRFEEIWAATGHPHGVFRLHPSDLQTLADAPAVADVTQAPVSEKRGEMLLARATTVATMTQDIPSPCISLCQMDESSGLCKGCWRSIEEIARWSACNDADKKAVWALIERRILIGSR